MKVVIQRVKNASVKVADEKISSIENGLLIFVGIAKDDTYDIAEKMAEKIVRLRIFSDENNKFNYSVKDINGELLVISQFTLLANTKKGNRPSFMAAAKTKRAKKLYEYFIDKLRNQKVKKVAVGIFGAMMDVSLVNDGPVTIILN